MRYASNISQTAFHSLLHFGQFHFHDVEISNLIEKDFAYAKEDGTVYFRTRKFKEYGKLSHKNLDDLIMCAQHKKSYHL